MNYQNLLDELYSFRDVEYDKFNSSLLNTKNCKTIGVRVPILRQIAKKWKENLTDLLGFPNDYHEVKMIKVFTLCLQPYPVFCSYIEELVSIFDSWAICDSCIYHKIKNHRKEFLPIVSKLFETQKEFYQRYALVTLLHEYMKEEYLPLIFKMLEECRTDFYYVHMAAAWLMAEILIKHYKNGVLFLKNSTMSDTTVNKSIQKAKESYRLTQDQKKYLESLKRKYGNC